MANFVLRCGKLFDSVEEKVLEKVLVFVENQKIVKVTEDQNHVDISGFTLIDLSDKFVTPGLIDCHMHITMNGEGSTTYTPYQTLGDFTLKGLRMVQEDLMAGFTTIRTLGDIGFVDVAVRNAINRGEFVGPRMLVSGPCLGTTGGHADSHFNPYINEEIASGNIGDGPDALMKAARYNIKHGADLIKFMSTGGVMSLGTTVGAQQMSFEEMKAIIDIANMYGLTTATHAHGTEGIKCAVKAGVTSIEHGMILDDECIEEMAKRGTFLVPTVIAAERIVTNGHKIGTPEWAINKAKLVLGTHKGGFQKARAAGVRIAFGTDAGTPFNFHGKQGYEFELLKDFGMTAEESLTAATKNAAELLRKSDTIGSVTEGKLADICAFDGDPREDISAMTRCVFVMKDGAVVKH